MEKKYLIDLKNAMFLRFTGKEMKDRLIEVHQHFEDGRKAGKQDTEIEKDLGPVHEYLKPYMTRTRSRKPGSAATLAAAVLCILFAVLCIYRYNGWYAGILTGVLSLLVWILSGESSLRPVLKVTKQEHKKAVIAALASFVLAVIVQLFILLAAPAVIRSFHESGNLSLSGTFIDIFLIISMCLAALLLVYGLYQYLKGEVFLFLVVPQMTGLLCSIISWRRMLDLVDTAEAPQFFISSYLVGLAVSICFYVVNRTMVSK